MSNQLEAGIKEFITELIESNASLRIDSVENRAINVDSQSEYNSLRILIVVKHCGIKGCLNSKLKFAFFDFLIRFPICLKYILDKKNITEKFSIAELTAIDKNMVRHISSAWDPDYYNYIGFLESRELINIRYQEGFGIQITELGENVIEKIQSELIENWIRRCNIIKREFGSFSDAKITELIKEHFSFTVI